MTQLEYARRGVITEKMRISALSEGVPPEFIRDGIAAGTIILCHNIKHANGTPLAVGAGLRTKVNANIGSSSDDLNVENELKKARAAVKYGADAIRYYFVTAPVMEAEALNFSEAGVREMYNKVVNTLSNVFEFYEMYSANNAKVKANGANSKNVLDKWILAKLNLSRKSNPRLHSADMAAGRKGSRLRSS